MRFTALFMRRSCKLMLSSRNASNGLLNRCTVKSRTEGSNPSLSAIFINHCHRVVFERNTPLALRGMPSACNACPPCMPKARGCLPASGRRAEISQEIPKTLVYRQDFDPCEGGKSAPLTAMVAPIRPLEGIDRVKERFLRSVVPLDGLDLPVGHGGESVRCCAPCTHRPVSSRCQLMGTQKPARLLTAS